MWRAWFPAVVLLTGCREHVLPTVDDEPVVVGAALLDVSPGVIDFGLVPPGETAVAEVTLSSTGEQAVTILDAVIDATAGSFSLLEGADGVRLDPGAQHTLTVVYQPEGPGDAATLWIQADGEAPEHAVSLTGEVQLPALSVAPAALTFGANIPSAAVLTLENTGSGVLELADVFVDDADRFSIGPLAETLAPGQQTPVQVSYTPDGDDTDDDGELWVDSNDPDAPLRVPISVEPPVLELAPGEVIFDPENELGITEAIAVKNAGAGLLVLDGIWLDGADNFEIVGLPVGAELRPGQQTTISVRYGWGMDYVDDYGVLWVDANVPAPASVALIGRDTGLIDMH